MERIKNGKEKGKWGGESLRIEGYGIEEELKKKKSKRVGEENMKLKVEKKEEGWDENWIGIKGCEEICEYKKYLKGNIKILGKLEKMKLGMVRRDMLKKKVDKI